jgi:hypothetical protein
LAVAPGGPRDEEGKTMCSRRIKKPMNPELYEGLWDHTNRRIEVINEGQPLRYAIVERNGRRGIVRSGSSGEEYVINCPVCDDTRGRCYVNHTFGTRIEGIPIYHLAFCQNEQSGEEVCKWLREMIKDGGWDCAIDVGAKREGSVLDPFEAARISNQRHEKLSPALSLSALPPGHPALTYLAGRGFDDIQYLQDLFRVGYFKGDPGKFRLANERIIIPIWFARQMVGWTARIVPGYTPTPKWISREPPKYYNSKEFNKSNFLYNFDLAKDADVIAVAEGVTDVWKIGIWGMALLGKSMSDQQCQLLCRAAENRGACIVLLGDGSTEKDNAAAAWEANYQRLRAAYRYPDRVRLHLFPQGDPGDRSSRELHDLVHRLVHRSNP